MIVRAKISLYANHSYKWNHFFFLTKTHTCVSTVPYCIIPILYKMHKNKIPPIVYKIVYRTTVVEKNRNNFPASDDYGTGTVATS